MRTCLRALVAFNLDKESPVSSRFLSITCKQAKVNSYVETSTGAEVAQLVWALGYGLDNWGSIPVWGREGIFFFALHFQTGSVTHSHLYPMGNGGSYLVVKRPGREYDH
jgi:hypothetical protein